MTARNLLAIKKLPAFKAWLDANNIENRATNAAYQVLQVRGVGDGRWRPIYKKLNTKEHLSVPRPLVFLIERFLRREKIEQPAPHPSPAAQGDIPDVVDVPDQCPYFGPSPHRDVWLAGWYAARAAQEGKSNDR